MKRLKVIRLVPQLDYGGVESRIALQASLINPEKIDFRVCTFWRAGHSAELVRQAGVSVDVLGEDPSVKNPRALAALYVYLKQQQADVLHASIGEAVFHGSIAGAMAGTKLRVMEEVGIPSRGPMARSVFWGLSHLSHRFVGVSQTVCDYLVQQERIDPAKVQLIYNTTSPDFFEPVAQRDYDVDASRPFRFLSVGRLEPVKNQEVLIRALALLRERGEDAQVDFAGEGSMKEPLRQLARQLGVEDRVNLLGFRDDTKALLAQADAYVLPSYTEGLSLAMVEAHTQAVPVMSSDGPALRETFGPLDQRYMIDAQDVQGWARAMTHMIHASASERRAHALKGQRYAQQRFSPQRYIQEISDLYQEAAL